MAETTTVIKAGRSRSPNYPSFDLGTAIHKAEVFYASQKRNPVHSDVAITTLGYKNVKSSEASRSVSTMISYGLLEDVGKRGQDRSVKLSQDGYMLAGVLAPDDKDRIPIIQSAAIRPKIYRDLTEKYPHSLPSDGAIEKTLMVDFSFNPAVVKDVVKNFRATYEYANMANSGILSEPEIDKSDGRAHGDTSSREHKNDAPKQDNLTKRDIPPDPAAPPVDNSGTGGFTMPAVADAFQLPIPLPNQRFAMLQTPPGLSPREYDRITSFIASNRDVVLGDKPYSAPTDMPPIRFKPATWKSADADRPVVITGVWGMRDGRIYVSIEGENTGIPFDEIVYDE